MDLLIQISVVFVQSVQQLGQSRWQLIGAQGIGYAIQYSFGCWQSDAEFQKNAVNSIDGGRALNDESLSNPMQRSKCLLCL
ncbi:hypothetical protein WT49_07470 [Burkholderia territorii]|nr:hypothetical protein WT50_31115 [Burkholderia territorii]KWE39754.1 hypothetical protein WT49_07470 [Burkholderia territorii]KWE42915.1 hypothetical protein WT51_01945 [Burkholderia territorii]